MTGLMLYIVAGTVLAIWSIRRNEEIRTRINNSKPAAAGAMTVLIILTWPLTVGLGLVMAGIIIFGLKVKHMTKEDDNL